MTGPIIKVQEHVPVMVEEVMGLLLPGAGRRYLDGTLGLGGHAEELLERSGPDGQVLGLDWDEEAIAAAAERLKRFGPRFLARRVNFTETEGALNEVGWERVDGILLDLGVSSRQLESPKRGFSFQTEARLDMRMDQRQSLDAHLVVNTYSVSQLQHLLREYGETPKARSIAMAIDRARQRKAIETTKELAEIVARVAGRIRTGIHPATQTFQALRIAVNRELENLEVFLEGAYGLLLPLGRMVILSFHSLEDRLVKKAFRKWSKSCLCPPRTPSCRCGWSRKVRLITPKPLLPSREEIQRNPRARSAKLRAVERL